MVKKSSPYSLCEIKRELRDIGVLTNISYFWKVCFVIRKSLRDAAWDSAVLNAILALWCNWLTYVPVTHESPGSSPGRVASRYRFLLILPTFFFIPKVTLISDKNEKSRYFGSAVPRIPSVSKRRSLIRLRRFLKNCIHKNSLVF